MSSGRTHDIITHWTAGAVLTAGAVSFKEIGLAVTISVATEFAGLMFGPDLDMNPSKPTNRWKDIRLGWLWFPYRRAIPHRSPLSHCPILGTVVRVVYFWIALWLLSEGCNLVTGLFMPPVLHLWEWSQQLWQQHPKVLLAIALGLEIGALSHITADWLSSSAKRMQRRGR